MTTICSFCHHDVEEDGCTYAQDAEGNIVSCAHCPKLLAGLMGIISEEDGGKCPNRTDDLRIYA